MLEGDEYHSKKKKLSRMKGIKLQKGIGYRIKQGGKHLIFHFPNDTGTVITSVIQSSVLSFLRLSVFLGSYS